MRHGWLEDRDTEWIYRPETEYCGRDGFIATAQSIENSGEKVEMRVQISVVEPGLVAHWDLEEGEGSRVADVSGYNHHGLIINGPRWEKGGLRFSRAQDHVEINPAPAFRFLVDEPYTLLCRVWVVTPPIGWSGVFTRGRDRGAWNGFWMSADQRWIFAHAGQNLDGPKIAIGKWTLLAGVYENGRQFFYVDGELTAETARPEKAAEWASIWLGGASSVNEFAEIVLDYARIYDRALSRAEIEKLSHRSANFREGSLRRQYWTGLKGDSVDDLRNSLRYPNQPDGVDEIPGAEAVSWHTPRTNLSWGDHYGQRISGWMRPPITGEYVFFLSSDDRSEFWLSRDHRPENLELLALVEDWSPHRFVKATLAQQSVPIYLRSDTYYYLEILHKENDGGDHVSLAWLKPGESGPLPSEIVPREYLYAQEP